MDYTKCRSANANLFMISEYINLMYNYRKLVCSIFRPTRVWQLLLTSCSGLIKYLLIMYIDQVKIQTTMRYIYQYFIVSNITH